MEGAEINNSLLALRNASERWVVGVPTFRFRDSKLTQVLRVKEFGVQDSLQLKLSSNEDEMMTQENEEDENLALLRAFKFMNMSVNIYTVHEAISHLQEIEEEIPYLHKTNIDIKRPMK
ncbi:hypothetical protein MRX96_054975 [Rhipicephalus microplus]